MRLDESSPAGAARDRGSPAETPHDFDTGGTHVDVCCWAILAAVAVGGVVKLLRWFFG